jgi:hypothetical protein
MFDKLTEWERRANAGDSRYAMALGLMAIANAINALAYKESAIVESVGASIDEKFDALMEVMEGKK